MVLHKVDRFHREECMCMRSQVVSVEDSSKPEHGGEREALNPKPYPLTPKS